MSNAVLTGSLNTLFLIYMTKYYQNHIFSFLKVWAKGKPRLCWLPAPGRRLTLCFDQSMHCNGGDFYFLSSLGVVTPFKITIIVDQSMIHSCYFSLFSCDTFPSNSDSIWRPPCLHIWQHTLHLQRDGWAFYVFIPVNLFTFVSFFWWTDIEETVFSKAWELCLIRWILCFMFDQVNMFLSEQTLQKWNLTSKEGLSRWVV